MKKYFNTALMTILILFVACYAYAENETASNRQPYCTNDWDDSYDGASYQWNYKAAKGIRYLAVGTNLHHILNQRDFSRISNLWATLPDIKVGTKTDPNQGYLGLHMKESKSEGWPKDLVISLKHYASSPHAPSTLFLHEIWTSSISINNEKDILDGSKLLFRKLRSVLVSGECGLDDWGGLERG